MKKEKREWKKSDIIYICVWAAIGVIVVGLIIGLTISSANAWKKNWINLPSVMEITLIEKADNTEHKYELELIKEKNKRSKIYIERDNKYHSSAFELEIAVRVTVDGNEKYIIKQTDIKKLYERNKKYVYWRSYIVDDGDAMKNFDTTFRGNHEYQFIIGLVSQMHKDVRGVNDWIPNYGESILTNIYVK